MREERGWLCDSRVSGHQSKLDPLPGSTESLAGMASFLLCPPPPQLPGPSSDGHVLSLETLLFRNYYIHLGLPLASEPSWVNA